jgi:hypothetical protein
MLVTAFTLNPHFRWFSDRDDGTPEHSCAARIHVRAARRTQGKGWTRISSASPSGHRPSPFLIPREPRLNGNLCLQLGVVIKIRIHNQAGESQKQSITITLDHRNPVLVTAVMRACIEASDPAPSAFIVSAGNAGIQPLPQYDVLLD